MSPDPEIHDEMIEVKEDSQALADQAARLEDLYNRDVHPPPEMDPVTGDKCGGEVIHTYSEYYTSLAKLAGIIRNECLALAADPRLQ